MGHEEEFGLLAERSIRMIILLEPKRVDGEDED
jgi:hypothetical protein